MLSDLGPTPVEWEWRKQQLTSKSHLAFSTLRGVPRRPIKLP